MILLVWKIEFIKMKKKVFNFVSLSRNRQYFICKKIKKNNFEMLKKNDPFGIKGVCWRWKSRKNEEGNFG